MSDGVFFLGHVTEFDIEDTTTSDVKYVSNLPRPCQERPN